MKINSQNWLNDNISGCSLAAQGLYLRLLFLMDKSENRGYLSLNNKPMHEAFMASKCGCSPHELRVYLKELEDCKVIEFTQEQIIFCPRMILEKKKISFRKSKIIDPVKAIDALVESPIKKQKKKKVIPFVDILPFESDVFKESWERWRNYRKQRGSTLTEITIDQQFQKFKEWGEEKSINIINQSILNGWQGLFENHQNKGITHDAPQDYSDWKTNDFISQPA